MAGPSSRPPLHVPNHRRSVCAPARLVKPGGVIAFTDWLEGDAEAQRFLAFMKFANVQDAGGYKELLSAAGCEVVVAEVTGRFAKYTDLYIDMLNMQLTYDALKIINFDTDLIQALGGEMAFMQVLAHEGKIVQGLFVARKT